MKSENQNGREVAPGQATEPRTWVKPMLEILPLNTAHANDLGDTPDNVYLSTS